MEREVVIFEIIYLSLSSMLEKNNFSLSNIYMKISLDFVEYQYYLGKMSEISTKILGNFLDVLIWYNLSHYL